MSTLQNDQVITLDYEIGRKNLEALVQWYTEKQGDRNEATTRLHLVDRLFFECLGWGKDDVILEESYGGEYADYTFMAPRRVLVVEAKKEGTYFELPAGKDKILYSLPSLCRDYADLKAALEQAALYGQNRGMPFAVVSNGHQIVAFVAVRTDGLPPLDGKALVFPSLDFMLRHFLELWQVVSKPGIESKNLQMRLIGDEQPQLPAKLSARIHSYPGVKGRNIFQTDLQILSELVVEDIARTSNLEQRFLEECYCQSGALAQNSLLSKGILQARYAALFEPEVAGPTTVPASKKNAVSSELLAESLSRRPILLIGDVGVGKTTFIRNLITVEAAELFEAAITFHIDLGSHATLAANLRHFILLEIKRQLNDMERLDVEERNFVRGVYHAELLRFERGIYGDLKETNPVLYREKEIQFLEEKIRNTDEHLRDVLNHLVRGRRKQIVVFLDNSDQRSEETQQAAFLVAQEMATRWPVTVFVSLRPETFYRSQQVGALSGYHPKAFTVAPPRVDQVIEKRLRFALKLTSGEIKIGALPEKSRLQLQKLDDVIRVFLHSISTNPALLSFIDNVSAGNVRIALDLVNEFFGSGHVDTEKITDIYQKAGRYDIPLHEFLRAVIYGDCQFYHPDRSPIANIFDITTADPKEHFIVATLLGLLASATGPDVQQGFVETAKVYAYLQANGFTADQIDLAVTRAHRNKLLETSARRVPVPGQKPPEALRLTASGAYHIRELCSLFVYIDAVMVDTPVLDPTFHSAIANVEGILDRLHRAELFSEYLLRAWSCLDGRVEGFSWPECDAALRRELKHVRGRLPFT